MIKIEFNEQAIIDILKSDELLDACEVEAERALNTLGKGYKMSTHMGPHRLNVEIAAVSYKAKKENMETNSILKALGG